MLLRQRHSPLGINPGDFFAGLGSFQSKSKALTRVTEERVLSMSGIGRQAERVQVHRVSAQVCVRASNKAFALLLRNVWQGSRICFGHRNTANLYDSCADNPAVFGGSA